MELSDLLSDELLAVCDTSSPEVDIDALFATAFQEFEATPIHANRCPTPTDSAVAERFAPPKTEAEILEARTKGIPKKTLEDTQYCIKVWEEWCNYRRKKYQDTKGLNCKTVLYCITHSLCIFNIMCLLLHDY